MYWKIVLLVFCAFIGQVVVVTKAFVKTGLRCYTCAFSSSDSDQSCLTITNDTRSVECPYTYCTIMRQEFLDPSGVVASFMRGCTDTPAFLNHEVTDTTFRTFYRACTVDLCNIGDGVQSVVGGSLQPRPEYTGENLLVPGTGNGAGKALITSFCLIFGLLLLILV